MFWGKVAWCPCASTNIKEMTIGVNVGYSSEVLCVTLQSQNWCFHLVSALFLETAWLFSSRALLRNDWAVMTFLKICSFFFDSKKHLMKNKLNTSEIIHCVAKRNWRATPHLCCQRGLLFPFMWLNPSASKISLRFPSHVAHTPPSFCRADRHIASDRCKCSLSSPWVPPAWFLWEVFAVWPALGTFFFFQ